MNIREIECVRQLLGERVVDITSHDPDDADRFIVLQFGNGSTLTIPCDEDRGIHIETLEDRDDGD